MRARLKRKSTKEWDRSSPCKHRIGHYEMVTTALCLCHLREVSSGENMTAFHSTCAAGNLSVASQGKMEMWDEWQMGKRLLIYIHPREQKQPHTGCVVCTQFDDLRIRPQSIGSIVKKCKTVAVITHGIIQKAMSRWEWATNHFTLPNSPSISTEPSWKGGWDLEESEHCLRWVDEGVQPAVA